MSRESHFIHLRLWGERIKESWSYCRAHHIYWFGSFVLATQIGLWETKYTYTQWRHPYCAVVIIMPVLSKCTFQRAHSRSWHSVHSPWLYAWIIRTLPAFIRYSLQSVLAYIWGSICVHFSLSSLFPPILCCAREHTSFYTWGNMSSTESPHRPYDMVSEIRNFLHDWILEKTYWEVSWLRTLSSTENMWLVHVHLAYKWSPRELNFYFHLPNWLFRWYWSTPVNCDLQLIGNHLPS